VSAAGGHKNPRSRRLSGKPHKVDSVRNDINVTPLVDVMLVLLIIFMLMTLVMGRGHDVKVPSARNYSEEKDKQQPVVTIDGEGNLYVEKNKLGPVTPSTLKEMENQVETHWKSPITIEAGGSGRVFLKAELSVTYDKIYPVLEYMNRTMNVPAIDIAIAKGGEK
jgi:biopolymer transport protein ExbD